MKSYDPKEIASIVDVYMRIAYAKIAIDTIDGKKNLKYREALARNILEHLLPKFYHTIPLPVRRRAGVDVKDLEERCQKLLE